MIPAGKLRPRSAGLLSPPARIVEADDGERRRIARDLHDGLQSRLVLLAMTAHRVRVDAAACPSVRADAAELESGLQAAITELRQIVHGLMPAALAEGGLYAAAEELADRMPIPTAVECDLGGVPLPGVVESTGYLVISEALANAVKHSRARSLLVRLRHHDESLRVEVSDDGVGGAHLNGGAGMRGMADRIDALGGVLMIDSPPGGGTRVVGEGPMGVVIGEDQALMREGMVLRLEREGFEVVGQAGDGEDLVRKANAHDPDVVVADIRMPPTQTDEGLHAALEIRGSRPNIAIVVLSHHVHRQYACELLESGAGAGGVGYLLKQRVADGDSFCSDLRRICAGALVLDAEVVAAMLGRARRDDPVDRLTSRQRDVLTLMAEGRSNAAIAERLFLSEKAVIKHISHVYRELGLMESADDHRRVLAVVRYLSR